MSEMIAKRYVKALIKSVDLKELSNVSSSLRSIVPAFKDLKVRTILVSNDTSTDEKVEFIVSMMENVDNKVLNLLKLLGDYGRLELLPTISKELDFEVAKLLNTHKGIVISGNALSDDKILNIANNLSKKYDTTIELENLVSDYNGIKVEIESLGLEIGFSSDRLKAQLSEHILKAI